MEENKSIEISIIVPTYNRKESLKRCLSSLEGQGYPRDKYEIIIVDDGSSYDVTETIKGIGSNNRNIKLIQQHHKGPASARNLGVEAALGNIIGFVDDDCMVDKDWVKLLAESHRINPNVIAIGGFTLTSTQKAAVLVSQFLSNCSIETYVNARKEVVFFPTCNVSLKKYAFEKYKFNENFLFPGGEDLEFFWQLFKDNYRFIWDKNIKVVHFRDDDSISFIKQAYIYGRGNLLAQHIHKVHPILGELKTGALSFWLATFINVIKIPRFSYLLGRRTIKENNIKNIYKKISIFSYYVLHKIFYILGNILEFIRITKEGICKNQYEYKVPQLLILDITHSCNLACRICDIWKTANIEKDIDISHVKRMLFQAKGLNIKEIAFSGGEPLLREDIYDIFEHSKKLKIKNLGILSNGILVENNMQKLLPYLLDNTISLVISLDSLSPDKHNYIRNSDSAWQKTKEALEKLSSLKKQCNQINFNIITIILNQNLEELLDLATFVKSLNANSLQFQALLSNNLRMIERKQSCFWVTEDRVSILDKALDGLIEFKKNDPSFIRNSIDNLLLIKKYYRGTITNSDAECFSADKTILISNKGECSTCFSSYGDIKVDDFKNILLNRKIIDAQEKVKKCFWPCLLPCFCD